MADPEGVVLAFLALGERCHAVLLLDGVDLVAATGQDLVRVGLVAHVPDQLVDRGLVQVVQGHGEFDHAEPGAEMTATLADRLDQVGTQFICDGRQFGFFEPAQVIRILDARQAGIACGIDHVYRASSQAPIFPPKPGWGKQTAVPVSRQ